MPAANKPLLQFLFRPRAFGRRVVVPVLARGMSMITRLFRSLVMGLLPIALIACMNSPPTAVQSSAAVPLGIDLGGSGQVTASPSPRLPADAMTVKGEAASSEHGGGMQMAHAGHNDAHGTGTVNSVDPAKHKVNL